MPIHCKVETALSVVCKCEKCGNEFQYLTPVEGRGGGGSRGSAQDLAQYDLDKKLKALEKLSLSNYKSLRHIQPAKCPHCGHLQSWMQLYFRSTYTYWVMIAAIFIPFIIMALIISDWASPVVAILGVLGVWAVAIGVIRLSYNPATDYDVQLPRFALPPRARRF